MEDHLLHRQLTERIIKAYYNVYNTLGYGFLEKVYENALVIELRMMGLNVKQQQPLKVYYAQQQVGYYSADLIVEDLVILELKAAETWNAAFEAQLLNYLRATEIEVGLVLNFGPKPEFKRRVFKNERKNLKIE